MILGLHVRLRLHMVELAFPVMSFVGIQSATLVGMFWAGRRARKQNDYKALIALSGIYCWSSGIFVLHYGNKWRLLNADTHDYTLFSILIMFAVVCIGVVVRFGMFPPKRG